jgi:hypothetical protein
MGSDVASASASASASACTTEATEATGGVLVDSCVHADSKRSLEIVAVRACKSIASIRNFMMQ